jgi:hypothetical protein
MSRKTGKSRTTGRSLGAVHDYRLKASCSELSPSINRIPQLDQND